jgi:CBS domain-containing protein
MTDLRRVAAATIGADKTVEEANQTMILRGVRLLLVTEAGRQMTGMITAHDILGEKPLRIGRERGARFSEILVRDVMVPYDELDAIEMTEVVNAQVGSVVATLKHNGRQHALVVDREGERQMVRGIFSASQIARQLGIPIYTTEVARTFAEIEAALAR